MFSTPKKFTPKTFQFIKDWNYKTFRIFRGFEQLSSSTGWRGMAEPVLVQIGLVRSLKGGMDVGRILSKEGH